VRSVEVAGPGALQNAKIGNAEAREGGAKNWRGRSDWNRTSASKQAHPAPAGSPKADLFINNNIQIEVSNGILQMLCWSYRRTTGNIMSYLPKET
jgi:hypothetical protein